MDCPQCHAPVAAGKAFCTRCGTAMTTTSLSTLTVDPDSLTRLLKVYAPQVELRQGKLVAGQVEVDPVRLLKPELKVNVKGYRLCVDQLTLGPDGLNLALRLE
jgi:hypothetical protein